MHFSHLHRPHGSNATKFALVAGLHALIAVGVVNMLNNRVISLPSPQDALTVFATPEPVEPPPVPVDPPLPLPQVTPPLMVPKIDVPLPLPPIDDPVQATTMQTPPIQQETLPSQPAQPAQAEGPARTGATSANAGTMHSAVLADASGCVKPNYPAASARNGDAGTVMLALLVGPDGRVTSARVQKSSGFRELDRAALNALSLCQFKPAMNNGVPEAGWAQLAYVWTLD